ncbi:MAG: CRISPR-associated protein Cas4, partial [Methanobacterium sp.]|nr:CRISPR-associated protein Cas4 [Methanobacterium sp.]
CLAFKEMLPEKRRIVASLRQRGTENIYWASYFDEKAEKDIINLINRIHKLLNGEIEYEATNNPNKCRSCRFNSVCEKKMDF